MVDNSPGDWSVGRFRTVTAGLASAVASLDPAASDELDAAARADVGPAEALLVMRSALVATRATWERLESESLRDEARRALAAGKRLAIELG